VLSHAVSLDARTETKIVPPEAAQSATSVGCGHALDLDDVLSGFAPAVGGLLH
jgi:hypothetical protein